MFCLLLFWPFFGRKLLLFLLKKKNETKNSPVGLFLLTRALHRKQTICLVWPYDALRDLSRPHLKILPSPASDMRKQGHITGPTRRRTHFYMHFESNISSFVCNIRVPTQVLQSIIKSYICFFICKALQSLIFLVFPPKRSYKVLFLKEN